jgi:hypothetical protein
MSKDRSRSGKIIRWIEKFCRVPLGPDRGKMLRLTPEQCATIRRLYDAPDGLPLDDGQSIQLDDAELAAYLALVHLASPEAVDQNAAPAFETNSFTVWNAADSPDLRRVLQRRGETVVCPALCTSYPTAA